jgi:small subunit ribosomal protein S2
MFIGTKRAACEIVKKYSNLTDMPYVNNRWLGGLLTNFNTVKQSIAKLDDLRNKYKNQSIYNLSKKQAIDLKRKIERLEKNLLGVQHLTKLPDAIFVIDTRYERIAIQEANKLNIPVIALVDSNNSFDGVDYMIPANDDAMSSIDLFMNSISKIILESKPKKVVSNSNSDKGEKKKSIKAKKILKAPEVKKVASKSKPTSKKSKDDKEILGDNRDE